MTISKEQIEKWAREVGTPYVNRHYPDVTHFGFGVDSLQAFAQLTYNAGAESEKEAIEDAMIAAYNEGAESALEDELLEQTRLLGMGSEREAALLGKVERLCQEVFKHKIEKQMYREETDRLEAANKDLTDWYNNLMFDYEALKAERERLMSVLKQARESMVLINDQSLCQASHHKKKDEHTGLQRCPVETRYQNAITAIDEVLK